MKLQKLMFMSEFLSPPSFGSLSSLGHIILVTAGQENEVDTVLGPSVCHFPTKHYSPLLGPHPPPEAPLTLRALRGLVLLQLCFLEPQFCFQVVLGSIHYPGSNYIPSSGITLTLSPCAPSMTRESRERAWASRAQTLSVLTIKNKRQAGHSGSCL